MKIQEAIAQYKMILKPYKGGKLPPEAVGQVNVLVRKYDIQLNEAGFDGETIDGKLDDLFEAMTDTFEAMGMKE